MSTWGHTVVTGSIRVAGTGDHDDPQASPLVVTADDDGTVGLGFGRRGGPVWRLDQDQAEDFARAFTSACWEAARMKASAAAVTA